MLTGFLGAMFASYTARHLRIDALTRLAPPRPRLALRVASTFGAIVIGSLIIWASLKYRTSVLDEAPVEGEIFTAARSAMIIVCGLSGMIFHFAVQIAIDLTYLIGRYEIPSFWIAEASHGGEATAEDDAASGGALHAGPDPSAASAARTGPRAGSVN